MARRAELLRKLKQEAPTLVVVGANEFLPDVAAIPAMQTLPGVLVKGEASAFDLEGLDAVKAVSSTSGPSDVDKYPATETICQIYEQMPVDLVYISPQALAWLNPKTNSKFISAPAVKRWEVSGLKLDIVFFADQNTSFPSSATPADLVLGISPWGFEAEYAERSNLPLHILLGAGEGAPLRSDISVPSVLWSRSDINGSSVLVLDIYSLPKQGIWQKQDFSVQELELTEDLPEDKTIKQLLDSKATIAK